MINAILVINAGSSSIKFSIFSVEQNGTLEDIIYRGEVSGIGQQNNLHIYNNTDKLLAIEEEFITDVEKIQNYPDAFDVLFCWIEHHATKLSIVAIGHRVVHGGDKYSAPAKVNEALLHDLETFIPLAPLHQPFNLMAIENLLHLKPEIPQVVCFDTAFHRSQPSIAQHFALPRELRQQGILKFGFHGLSYEYIASVLPEYLGDVAEKRVIVAHLGNGASMCAMKSRCSVATTMTFSPLDGLLMGTRCGALDPSVVLFLMREKGMDIDAIDNLLNFQSGLLGVSDISDDMQVLLDSNSPQAAEAVDLFVYQVSRELGSLAAALGGLDALIFTAGIGEHSEIIRHRICQTARWLGLQIDDVANKMGGPRISTVDSLVSAWVIPTNEELVIAKQTLNLMNV